MSDDSKAKGNPDRLTSSNSPDSVIIGEQSVGSAITSDVSDEGKRQGNGNEEDSRSAEFGFLSGLALPSLTSSASAFYETFTIPLTMNSGLELLVKKHFEAFSLSMTLVSPSSPVCRPHFLFFAFLPLKRVKFCSPFHRLYKIRAGSDADPLPNTTGRP